nr:MAG TPA: CREB-binding protein [Caudoviricetes sp.]
MDNFSKVLLECINDYETFDNTVYVGMLECDMDGILESEYMPVLEAKLNLDSSKEKLQKVIKSFNDWREDVKNKNPKILSKPNLAKIKDWLKKQDEEAHKTAKLPENAFLTMAKFKSFDQFNKHFVARQTNAKDIQSDRDKGKSSSAIFGKLFIDSYIGAFKDVIVTSKWAADNVIPIIELLLSGKVSDVEKWANTEFDRIQKEFDAEVARGKENAVTLIQREAKLKITIALVAAALMAFRYIVNKAIGVVKSVITPIKETLKESAEEMPALESYIAI